MSRDKSHKPFELVDADKSGLAFYYFIEEATDAALHYWGLRWGWSIWRIEQNSKRSLWVQSYTEDFCCPKDKGKKSERKCLNLEHLK